MGMRQAQQSGNGGFPGDVDSTGVRLVQCLEIGNLQCSFGLDLTADGLVGVGNLVQLMILSPNLVEQNHVFVIFCLRLAPPLSLPCVCVWGGGVR
jgi:hypothetical protein